VGDIIGGVFGGGSRTSQDVKLDPTTQALNRMRLDQARNLYSQGSLGSYAQPGGSAYAADPRVSALYDQAVGTASTPFDLAGYEQRGLDRGLFNEGLDVSRGNINQGLGNVAANYADASGNTLASYNNAIGAAGGAYGQGMAANEAATQRALAYGTDAASNYINRIATPQLMQQATLQGLEGGGAVPASIAKATADVGLQWLSPIVQQSLGIQGQLAQGYGSDISQLSGANAAAQAQLGGQNTALQSGLYGDYSNAVNAAYGNRQGLESQFMSTLPGAYGTSVTAPAQARSLAAQGAATLFPLADYGRGLQEQDLLRRQGLATTAYTGLPYTPATSTAQRQSTQPLWNFFGQG
jgi:hypothetical protein